MVENLVNIPKHLTTTLGGDPEKHTLLLKINTQELGQIPNHVESERSKFEIRPETHVTILGFPAGEIVKQKIDEGVFTQVEFDTWISSFSGLEIIPKDEFMELQEKELKDGNLVTKRSIIQMVEVPDLEVKLSDLKKLLKIKDDEKFPYSPPHITLYTPEGQPRGIGITDVSELQNPNFDIEDGISAISVRIDNGKVIPIITNTTTLT